MGCRAARISTHLAPCPLRHALRPRCARLCSRLRTLPPSFCAQAAGESKSYTVHYVPLTMAKEGSPHKGQLFLPLPDGSAQLYSLEGLADPPASAGTISVEVGARVRKPIMLPVRAARRSRALRYAAGDARSAARGYSCALSDTRCPVARASTCARPRPCPCHRR